MKSLLLCLSLLAVPALATGPTLPTLPPDLVELAVRTR
jgi:hypothetical protein